ncbi:MAG: arsenate reductase ArsC [Thermoflavifilum sp.]|nr:arsenate reductase ArsC [Thermoflavifilum sp.]
MMRILILCTGNSCRSQMAKAFLKSFDPNLEVYAAGTRPSDRIHPKAIQVMKELGIDISTHHPKSVELFLNQAFDYVITVCDQAKETCPVFAGEVGKYMHIGFEDPAEATGTAEEILTVFRKVRDDIQKQFMLFYKNLKS